MMTFIFQHWYQIIQNESESYLAVSMVTGRGHEKSYFLATLQNFRYVGHKSNPKLGNFKQHDDITNSCMILIESCITD